MLVLKGLVGFHSTVQLQLLQHYWWGIDLDYCDIEWFALETNSDHSVFFEIASKYCKAATAQEWSRGATSRPRSGVAAGRSYPPPKARGGGGEELPTVQGAVAAQVQEGQEELLHVQGQEGWP